MSIITVPSNGDGGLNEIMNPRFGRCPSFTIVIIEEKAIKEVKTIPNPGAGGIGSAGIQAAQMLGVNNVDTLIAGFLGSNAAEALSSLKIKVFHAPDQSLLVKDIIKQYLDGKLDELKGSNVSGHHGKGGQGSFGLGRGA